jgi:hypothetical protein
MKTSIVTEGQRQPGALKGRLFVGKEFFDELPPDELAAWS